MGKIISKQPGFILHRQAYLNTSMLLSVYTKEYGLIKLVAKGVMRKNSKLSSVLSPFASLELTYKHHDGLSVLFDVDTNTRYFGLPSNKYYLGLYLNELMLKLLPAYDPQPELYLAYQQAIDDLYGEHAIEPVLRKFEISLLQQIGYGVDFSKDADTGAAIIAAAEYYYYPRHGFVKVVQELANAKKYTGVLIMQIAMLNFTEKAVLAAAKHILRATINDRLGNQKLMSNSLIYRAGGEN